MYDIRNVSEDVVYIGCSTRCLSLFESAYPIPNGISYNSYLINDEKTAVLDTVDKSCSAQYFQNLEAALDGRELDYLIVQHMEPDHCALIEDITTIYPNVKIVCSAKTVGLIKQFFNFDIDSFAIVTKEGDTLNLGRHELSFVMAPMVHWPEVMVTYDKTTGALFSADAFGAFGAKIRRISHSPDRCRCRCGANFRFLVRCARRGHVPDVLRRAGCEDRTSRS